MSKEVTEKSLVRLQEASLDDRGGVIVAHGWLDLAAMEALHVGDYQREILESRGGKKSSLYKAVEEAERLPDVMLGMRGQNFTSKGKDMLLEDDVFIVDGLQRISALRKFAADHPNRAREVRIGAEIRFATTRDSERDLFTILNLKRRAMAPSIILRNTRNHSSGVATLYGLTMNDKNSALFGRVCWNQQMSRLELMTAVTFAKAVITLHRHMGSGGRHFAITNMSTVLDNLSGAAGLANFRTNINSFFDLLDHAWGVRGIKYMDRVTHLRSNFMTQLAAVLSDHEDFWDGNKLVVDAILKSKMKSFPIDDPTIIRLAGAGNVAGALIYRLIVDHINKSRQTSRHLTVRRFYEYKGGRKGSNHIRNAKKAEPEA